MYKMSIWIFLVLAKFVITWSSGKCGKLEREPFHIILSLSYAFVTWIFLFQLRVFNVTVEYGRNGGILP